jgi:hypothetical protein
MFVEKTKKTKSIGIRGGNCLLCKLHCGIKTFVSEYLKKNGLEIEGDKIMKGSIDCKRCNEEINVEKGCGSVNFIGGDPYHPKCYQN